MKSVAHPPRRGFTLVELLMVITIIGMLMAMLVVAVNRGLVRARQAQTTVQIDTLDQAVQSAKSQYGLYPPDCSNYNTGASVAYRQQRILAFFRKAFPKMILPQGYAGTPPNSANPPKGSLQYLSQYAWGNAAQIQTPSGYILGDLDNLDPAEALVFFLGGPPAGIGQAINSGGGVTYAYSYAGWSTNASNPFTIVPGQRGSSLFEFQTQRLGDADGDGWPEYYPPTGEIPQPPGTPASGVASPTAPYVYFDALTYGGYYGFTGSNSGARPTATNNYPTGYPFADAQLNGALQTQMNGLQAMWGLALPYVNSQATNPAYGPNVNDYVNPSKFQIVAAGADGRYSTPPYSPPGNSQQAFRFFPSQINFSQGDLDNLSNFTTGRLQDTTP